MGNFFSTREKNSTREISVGLSAANLTFIVGFHGQVIKNKIRNHSINEVENLGYDKWLI